MHGLHGLFLTALGLQDLSHGKCRRSIEGIGFQCPVEKRQCTIEVFPSLFDDTQFIPDWGKFGIDVQGLFKRCQRLFKRVSTESFSHQPQGMDGGGIGMEGLLKGRDRPLEIGFREVATDAEVGQFVPGVLLGCTAPELQCRAGPALAGGQGTLQEIPFGRIRYGYMKRGNDLKPFVRGAMETEGSSPSG